MRTTPSYRERPTNKALRARELSPWRVVERGPVTMAEVFLSRFDQGRASTEASKIYGGWTEKSIRGLGVTIERICGSSRKISKTEEVDREVRK